MGFSGVNYEHFVNMARIFMNIGDLFNFRICSIRGCEPIQGVGL